MRTEKRYLSQLDGYLIPDLRDSSILTSNHFSYKVSFTAAVFFAFSVSSFIGNQQPQRQHGNCLTPIIPVLHYSKTVLSASDAIFHSQYISAHSTRRVLSKSWWFKSHTHILLTAYIDPKSSLQLYLYHVIANTSWVWVLGQSMPVCLEADWSIWLYQKANQTSKMSVSYTTPEIQHIPCNGRSPYRDAKSGWPWVGYYRLRAWARK